jgi:hypothetical protein
MKWEKLGLIYVPTGRYEWMASHAQLPTADKVSDHVLRIYFGTRDRNNRTVTTYIEVETSNLRNVLQGPERPVLELGELGCFDDGGAMPAWIVHHGGMKYLYYIGWNAGASVSYRNSIGLAISEDGGQTFTRMFKGPIMDRTKSEPQFCSSPCVMFDNGYWRMWYLSCLRWEIIDGRTEPIYHIKYAESKDGIDWERPGIVCIDLKSTEEGGITRPCVIHEDDIYKMWYSYRGVRDYRTNRAHTWRIGYAESKNGIEWKRMDEEAGIDVSEEGWDSQMIGYAYVFGHKEREYMLYNGNGFGASGIGCAVLSLSAGG